ncbi:alanine racemase [Trypanosoma rangeli]|uniref:Alanine racemase n=1 Tax=Trypanosoma rangeli TaxID=5698 RepID=A0A3R7N6A7_TRYRA|nr:alanine racemase [Trypanosoma rangeli]RNE97234.1 alanine racemase [Trypanosoma rangeli]|eukprot:RNE97234.1 alanine racemase [Trypanosoma rangeli]
MNRMGGGGWFTWTSWRNSCRCQGNGAGWITCCSTSEWRRQRSGSPRRNPTAMPLKKANQFLCDTGVEVRAESDQLRRRGAEDWSGGDVRAPGAYAVRPVQRHQQAVMGCEACELLLH